MRRHTDRNKVSKIRRLVHYYSYHYVSSTTDSLVQSGSTETMAQGRGLGVVHLCSIFLIAQANTKWSCSSSSKYGLTLNHTYFMKKTVRRLSDCLFEGEKEKKTQSVSYGVTTGTCELFNSSHLQHNKTLIPKEDSVYMHFPRHPCSQQAGYLCTRKGQCVRNEISPSNVHCKCPKGFHGKNCYIPGTYLLSSVIVLKSKNALKERRRGGMY